MTRPLPGDFEPHVSKWAAFSAGFDTWSPGIIFPGVVGWFTLGIMAGHLFGGWGLGALVASTSFAVTVVCILLAIDHGRRALRGDK